MPCRSNNRHLGGFGQTPPATIGERRGYEPTPPRKPWDVRAIRAQEGVRLLHTRLEGFEHLSHGLQAVVRAQRPQALPHQALAAQFGPDRSEEGTATLLGVVHQTRQPHPPGTHPRKMWRARAVMVRKMVALGFQRLARLMCTLPPRPATAFSVPSGVIIGSGMRGITSRTSGGISAAPTMG